MRKKYSTSQEFMVGMAIFCGVILLLIIITMLISRHYRMRAQTYAKKKRLEEGGNLSLRMSPSPAPDQIVIHSPPYK
jgi:uncharacterized SAM-binding protein YcdF (DUF218 family)